MSRAAEATVVRAAAEVDALADEWRALPLPRAAPCTSSGPEFLKAWLPGLGRGAAPRVVAVRRGGRLLGVVPLVARTSPARQGGRQLSLAGSRRPPMTDLADVRVVPGEELAVAEALATLLDDTARDWDTLYIGNAAADSRTFGALVAEIELRGWTVAARARPAMVTDTSGDWERYRAGLPRSLRALPQRLRRLSEMGEVRVEHGLTGDQGGRALEDLIRLYRARWGAGNWLDDPAYRRFLVDLREALDPGARVAGVWLDGAPLALQLILREGDRDQSLLVAVRRDHPASRESPGSLLQYLLTEQAFADETREVHLLHTATRQKMALATHVVTEVTWIALSPHARRSAAVALPAVEGAIVAAHVVRRGLRRRS